jgi:hypothetical protein
MAGPISRLGAWLWPETWLGRGLHLAAWWSVGLTVVSLWRAPAPPPVDRPLQLEDGDYVTSAECRSCHPSQYGSWHASFHRTMTQPATPENILPEMDGLELALGDTLYRVERRGEAHFVRRRAATAAAFGEPREIVLLTGSHHQQNFWLASDQGRSLEAFPFGWIIAEKMWAPVSDTFLSPPELDQGRAATLGTWNAACLNCHVTHGRSRNTGTGAFDSRVAEFGIACEACHGEGREHVELNRNPLRRYLAHASGGGDPSISNPAKLKGPESALACGQCHSVWAFKSAEAELAWDRDGAKFRPGQSGLPDRFVAQPAAADFPEEKRALLAANPHFFTDSFWSDGMVRVTGREYNGVAASPCFTGGHFSCVSCHEMHSTRTDRASLAAWAPSQMKPGALSDQACLSCHQPIAADIPAHTRHAAGSAGSRCYDCHMPYSSFGLLRAVRSHQVTSPTVAESVQVGRPNACNLCHLDKPLAWTAEKLRDWYGHPAPALSRDDREIAAGARWLLQGDAGQRALVAWSMGWAPAQAASGRAWLAPYLAITLNDPYSAVRFVAWKSLQTLPGFEKFSFTYTASDPETYAAAMRAYQQSLDQRRAQPATYAPATLLDTAGRFESRTYDRLLDARDQRRVYLIE